MRRCYLVLIVLSAGLHALLSQEDEVIYHVVQRSFYDGNGDLHGDLTGLHSKLGYLQDLGVTSILLLPLYHSPYYHNYFATDFETIDPEFGTREDYHALIKDLHARGMKLYMDMETQYVTEDHEWYRDSYGNSSSKYSDYLVYNGPGNTDPESIIFDLTELPGYDGTTRKVTTVNLNNKDVLDYNIRLFRYWVDPNGDGQFDDGIDGFRLDHMMDDLDWKGKFTGLFQNFWSPLIDTLKSINPDLKFIAEQARWESWGAEYLRDGNVDRIFAFNLLRAICSFDKELITLAADSTFSMVDDQRQVIVMIENHDIDRFASVVEGHPGKLKIGAVLNLLIGGIPSIYYGQELGMTGAGGFGKFGNTDGNDIPRREAFEWYSTVDGVGMALWYQDSGPWWDQSTLRDNDGISLEEQSGNAASLYHTYRLLLDKRKALPALTFGDHKVVANKNPNVYSFMRDNGEQRLLIVVNLSEKGQSLRLSFPGVRESPGNLKVHLGEFSYNTEDDFVHIDLPGYRYGILEIAY